MNEQLAAVNFACVYRKGETAMASNRDNRHSTQKSEAKAQQGNGVITASKNAPKVSGNADHESPGKQKPDGVGVITASKTAPVPIKKSDEDS